MQPFSVDLYWMVGTPFRPSRIRPPKQRKLLKSYCNIFKCLTSFTNIDAGHEIPPIANKLQIPKEFSGYFKFETKIELLESMILVSYFY